MGLITQLIAPAVQNARSLVAPVNNLLVPVRNASKKAGGHTKNRTCNTRPKHRGWRVQDGTFVRPGTILATQRTTRFHPGLNVGFGRNGTLFAIEEGRVVVTCEKVDLNESHTWIVQNYGERLGMTIHKKHFNVIPEPQHKRFVLLDQV